MFKIFFKLKLFKYSLMSLWRILEGHCQILFIILAIVLNFFGNYCLNIAVSEAATVYKSQPPNEPSVAVLPFDNLSGDLVQEYLSDGITDGIIADLSKNRNLLVITRNSTFLYKGKSIPIKQIAEQLGIRYVLKGGVVKSNRSISIDAQLIDTNSENIIWAKKFDGQFEDLLVLQDKIYQGVLTALKLKPNTDQITQAPRKSNIKAYDAYMQGLKYYYGYKPADWAEAIKHFQNAINIDPNYSSAYALIAASYLKTSDAPKFSHTDLTSYTAIALWQKPRLFARKYLDVAMEKPTCTSCLVGSSLSLFKRDYDDAISLAEKAIDLNPNYADGYFNLAYMMAAYGKPDIALHLIDIGKRIDPLNISIPLYLQGIVKYSTGEVKEAVSFIEKALSENPSLPQIAPIRAAAYAQLGDLPNARKALKDFQASWTRFFHIRDVMDNFPFENLDVLNRLSDGLVKAGLVGNPGECYKILQKNRLTGIEITNQIFNKKVESIDFYGKPYIISRDTNGKTQRQMLPEAGVRFDDEGVSWIENDMLCERWNIALFGVQQCMTIFRNPDYPTNMDNEYIIVSDYEARPLSQSQN